MGTLSPYGEGPYEEKVMDKVTELQQIGVVKMGFDRAGTSTTAPQDKDVDWTDAEQIRQSTWMYGYKTSVKRILQIESQGFLGLIEAICIDGGPVTKVEAAEMEKIAEDAKRDALKSGVKLRIKITRLSYRDFLDEYEEEETAFGPV